MEKQNSCLSSDKGTEFLQWALPQLNYRWDGFRKPRGQVIKRIKKRIRELNLTGGYSEYKQYLQNHKSEWDILDSLCDITISKFFRDRKVWDFLRDDILPKLYHRKNGITLSAWSCGCCNGEEPYSIAIITDQISGRLSSKIDSTILATDRNRDVLNRAKARKYPKSALKELREEEIRTSFTKIENKPEIYQVNKSLTENIQFEKRDIRNSMPSGIFDIVFCRNLVFTYFTKEMQEQFLVRLQKCMRKGSVLVTGNNENILPVNWLKRVDKSHPVFEAI